MEKSNLRQLNPNQKVYIKRSVSRFNDEIQFIDRYFVDIGIRSIGIYCGYKNSGINKWFPFFRKHVWGLELTYERFGKIGDYSYIAALNNREEAERALNVYRIAFSNAEKK